MDDDHSFSGTCPTCGQKYCGAEIERLRAENTNLRASMDSIRAIVLAARDLEQASRSEEK